MAGITLNNLRHSYLAQPVNAQDWALKQIDLNFKDGGAYALLGSSGCGKTTMLNLISGLLNPTQGSILFDDVDMTNVEAQERNIAQVFQFPVVYDTMTVRKNLEFPLRNRGVPQAHIDRRVTEIAAMLDLSSSLDTRASGLTADGKQKISLGRGLVRSDVNAVLFDEPLTVIDPHLKWQLRSKLKELHQQFGLTMVYVTHDQTEALTFADEVVVMNDGMVLQSGTPVELFEQPKHTFVGHFIGSPGMNVLPGRLVNGKAGYAGQPLVDIDWRARINQRQSFEIGVRPEFVRFANHGIPVTVEKVDHNGRARIVQTRHKDDVIRLIVAEDQPIPARHGCLQIDGGKANVYVNGWLQEKGVRA